MTTVFTMENSVVSEVLSPPTSSKTPLRTTPMSTGNFERLNKGEFALRNDVGHILMQFVWLLPSQNMDKRIKVAFTPRPDPDI